MSGRVNGQDLIKAEKEWLIDYYFKDDSVFNHQLSNAALLIYQDKIDSARIILKKCKLDNKAKEIAYSYYLAYTYLMSNEYVKGYTYCDSILKKIDRNNNDFLRFRIELECLKTKISSDSSNLLSKVRIKQLQIDYLQQIRFAREHKYYFGFVQLCRRYAWYMFLNSSQYLYAEKIYLDCIEISSILDFKLLKAKCLDELPIMYQRSGNLNKSYEYSMQAVKLNEDIGFISGKISAYEMYAQLSTYTGDFNKTLIYQSKVINYYKEIKDSKNLTLQLCLYANYLERANKNNLAIKYYKEAISYAIKENSINYISLAKNYYYRFLIENNKNYSDAENKEILDYFSFSEKIYNNSSDEYIAVFKFPYLANKAKYLMNKHENKKSEIVLNEIITSKDSSVIALVQSPQFIYKTIYESYEANNNSKIALKYFKKYVNEKDSINNKIKIQNFVKQDLEAKNEKEKNELLRLKETQKQQFELMNARRETTIKYIVLVLGLLLIILLFGIYLYIQKVKSEKTLSDLNNELYTKNIEIQNTLEYAHKIEKDIILQKIETQNKVSEYQLAQAELKALRSQMNPHFLFNAINSIQSYMLKNDSILASKYLTKFARLIRSVLENSKQEFVLLSTEINTLELYVELEAMRSSFEFDYEFILEDGLNSSEYLIPPMIIQPYVENAILHGITQLTDRRGKLSIIFSIQNQILKCIVDDNGIGRKEAMEIKAQKNINRKSMGLEVTNNRIEILNKHNKMFAQVNIIDKFESNTSMGTRVEIEITLNKTT